MSKITELDRLRGKVVSEITLECGTKIMSAFLHPTELRTYWCPIHQKTEQVISYKKEVKIT